MRRLLRDQARADTLPGMKPHAAEQQRQKGNLIRFGTVAELDLDAARCRVSSGQITSDWIPWLVPRVGNTIEWSAPSAGEQGLVICPDGDTAGAVFLRGIYSDAIPAPDSGEHVHLVRFPDGTTIRYDDEAHALGVNIADGGTVTVTASGGVTVNADDGVTVNAKLTTINGDMQVNGDIDLTGTATAQGDVIAGAISLRLHTHPGVESGSSVTGPPA